MEKEANKILENFKNGKTTLDKTRRLLFVLTGVRNSATCDLDRKENECSIYLHTKGKCSNCAHSR